MLPITKARPVERSITLKSNIPGFPDRTFILKINPHGVTVKDTGTISWKQLVSLLLVHGGEK